MKAKSVKYVVVPDGPDFAVVDKGGCSVAMCGLEENARRVTDALINEPLHREEIAILEEDYDELQESYLAVVTALELLAAELRRYRDSYSEGCTCNLCVVVKQVKSAADANPIASKAIAAGGRNV